MDLFHYEDKPVKNRGSVFFWWAVVLLLLTGACLASWIGSFYVVSHPEQPRCYRILKKLKRLDAPKGFPTTQAPRGDFLSATKLLDRYGKLGPAELARDNAELLRAYLMNYRESKRRVTYVVGKYDVVQTFPLGATDLFPSGVAVVSQSLDLPQVLLESVFTAPAAMVPAIRSALPTGGDIPLQRSHDLFALIHVARLEDGRMQFTTVPIDYGAWQVKRGSGGFQLTSPEDLEKADPKNTLNIAAGLPIVRGERLQQGVAAYVAFRRKALANAKDDEVALAGPELIRFDPTRSETEDAATPRVVRTPLQNPAAGTPPTPAPLRAMPTPAPAVPLPPRPVVRGTPRPLPPPATPPPALITAPTPAPVVAATPAPAPAPPSLLKPFRRVVSTSEASRMVENFSPGENMLLSGDFVVTGVLGQRVALRTTESLRDAGADPTQPGTSAALIVVDFPAGTTPPAKDEILSRDTVRPFAVRDVIRGRNGQITIVAAMASQ